MVDKYSSCSKMTLLKPLTLGAVGNDDRMLRSKFCVVCKCPAGHYKLRNAWPTEIHRATNARSLPEGGVRDRN